MTPLSPAAAAALRYLCKGEATKQRIVDHLWSNLAFKDQAALDSIEELLGQGLICALPATNGLDKRFAVRGMGRAWLDAEDRRSTTPLEEWKRRVESRFEAIFEAAQEVLRQYPSRDQAAPVTVTSCNAQEPSAEDEWEEEDGAAANVCLSEEALDAWWAALPIEQKAEAMTNHFEYHAALRQPAPPLTDAGRAAVGEEVQA